MKIAATNTHTHLTAKQMQKKNKIKMDYQIFFLGVDGRVFCSAIQNKTKVLMYPCFHFTPTSHALTFTRHFPYHLPHSYNRMPIHSATISSLAPRANHFGIRCNELMKLPTEKGPWP